LLPMALPREEFTIAPSSARARPRAVASAARRTWALICSVAAVILSAPWRRLRRGTWLPLAETGPEELVDYIITPPRRSRCGHLEPPWLSKAQLPRPPRLHWARRQHRQ
jgi:hypothetical protein